MFLDGISLYNQSASVEYLDINGHLELCFMLQSSTCVKNLVYNQHLAVLYCHTYAYICILLPFTELVNVWRMSSFFCGYLG